MPFMLFSFFGCQPAFADGILPEEKRRLPAAKGFWQAPAAGWSTDPILPFHRACQMAIDIFWLLA
jgi:hypothetical protein